MGRSWSGRSPDPPNGEAEEMGLSLRGWVLGGSQRTVLGRHRAETRLPLPFLPVASRGRGRTRKRGRRGREGGAAKWRRGVLSISSPGSRPVFPVPKGPRRP